MVNKYIYILASVYKLNCSRPFGSVWATANPEYRDAFNPTGRQAALSLKWPNARLNILRSLTCPLVVQTQAHFCKNLVLLHWSIIQLQSERPLQRWDWTPSLTGSPQAAAASERQRREVDFLRKLFSCVTKRAAPPAIKEFLCPSPQFSGSGWTNSARNGSVATESRLSCE